jgi:hypothetical protein
VEAAYEEAVAVGGVVGVEDELRLVNVREPVRELGGTEGGDARRIGGGTS